uniref:Uncharacterized protein n=1 Tax=Rhizophora mucronata TaxID=61149 RepID=A0A2P2R3G7_RHIMU
MCPFVITAVGPKKKKKVVHCLVTEQSKLM